MGLAEFSLLAFLCAWWPLADPVAVKALFLPACILFIPATRMSRSLILTFVLALLLLWVIPGHEQSLLFWELIPLLGLALGLKARALNLQAVFLWFLALNLGFMALYMLQWLPFEITQAFVLSDRELFGRADGFPGLLGNPSSLCLALLLGIAFIQNQWMFLAYCGFCLPLILPSTSTLGILLFAIAILVRLLKWNSKRGLCALLVVLVTGLLLLPEALVQRPLKTRALLMGEGLSDAGVLGKGTTFFQRQRSEEFHRHAVELKISRNQFHPHNDLIWHWLSYGLPGLVLRLLLLLYLVARLLPKPHAFPLILGLFQIQFTPDALALPSGFLLFFVCGYVSSKREEKSWWPLGHSLLWLVVAALYYYNSWYHSKVRNDQELPMFPPPAFTTISQSYNQAARSLKDGQLELALKQLHDLHLIAPDFYELPYLRAIAYLKTNQKAHAKNQLIRMQSIHPDHLYSRQLLADIDRE